MTVPEPSFVGAAWLAQLADELAVVDRWVVLAVHETPARWRQRTLARFAGSPVPPAITQRQRFVDFSAVFSRGGREQITDAVGRWTGATPILLVDDVPTVEALSSLAEWVTQVGFVAVATCEPFAARRRLDRRLAARLTLELDAEFAVRVHVAHRRRGDPAEDAATLRWDRAAQRLTLA